MFAKKQILTTGLIAAGLTASIAFQTNAQNQFNPSQVQQVQKPLLSAQASQLYGVGATQAVQTNQVNGQLVGQNSGATQFGYQQVVGAQVVAPSFGTSVVAAPLVAGYGYTGGQALQTGYTVGAIAPVTGSTAIGFANNSSVSGAQVAGGATANGVVVGQAYQGAYQVAAPAAVASYGYAAQPAYATGYTQGYVQAAPQVAYTQYQVAQPAIRYAYAQPAVRYGYVQQAAQQQQVATGGAAYYQSYSAAIRPTLPKPTVITKTYKTGGSTNVTTTSQTAALAKTNAVPYDNCVAGCEEACSQNQSFLSHCVKACGDLVKVIGQNQSYAVDWKTAGAQAGRAVIAAHGGKQNF